MEMEICFLEICPKNLRIRTRTVEKKLSLIPSSIIMEILVREAVWDIIACASKPHFWVQVSAQYRIIEKIRHFIIRRSSWLFICPSNHVQLPSSRSGDGTMSSDFFFSIIGPSTQDECYFVPLHSWAFVVICPARSNVIIFVFSLLKANPKLRQVDSRRGIRASTFFLF